MTTPRYFLGWKGNKLNNAALILVIMPAIVTFGYNQSLVGGLTDFKAFERQFPQMSQASKVDKAHKTLIRGTITALYAVGGIFGAVACVYLGDVKGRRMTLFVAAAIQIVGAILMASSFSMAQFVVSRIVLGIGTGGVLATTSVWQSEISTAKRRGSHVSFVGVFLGVGLCLSLWVDFAFWHTSGQISFRFPFAFQIIISLMVMVFVFQFPESPRFLIKKGRVDEAKETMKIIEDGFLSEDEVNQTILDQQISLELAGKSKMLDVFKMGPQRTLQRTILAVLALVGLQLTGVNAITLYTGTIFGKYLGLKQGLAKPLSALYQMTSIVGGFLGAYTVERWGRRVLLMGSALGNCITMVLLAALLSYPENKAAVRAATFFVYLYHFTYVIGWGGVPFLYASEIAPLTHRVSINGLAVAGFWSFNFMIAEVSPTAYDNINAKYLAVWAGTNFMLIAMVYFFYPETSGRSLEEIDEIFASSSGWFELVKVARRLPHRHLAELHKRSLPSTPHSGSSLGFDKMTDNEGKPMVVHKEEV